MTGETSDAKQETEFPTRGALLGIDFGTRRVGVAISDSEQIIAAGLYNYDRIDTATDEAFFCGLAAEYEAVGFVVGLPVHMSGDESKKSGEARNFGAWLNRRSKLPVVFHDERHSSSVAQSHLHQAGLKGQKAKNKLDMVAAQVILQSFLNQR